VTLRGGAAFLGAARGGHGLPRRATRFRLAATDSVEVGVADSGPGIGGGASSGDIRDFFVRVDRTPRMGLGLAICEAADPGRIAGKSGWKANCQREQVHVPVAED